MLRPARSLKPWSTAESEQEASSTEELRARTAAWLSTSRASDVTSPTQPCSQHNSQASNVTLEQTGPCPCNAI